MHRVHTQWKAQQACCGKKAHSAVKVFWFDIFPENRNSGRLALLVPSVTSATIISEKRENTFLLSLFVQATPNSMFCEPRSLNAQRVRST
jgi:hypothetical protein